ncbi:MAG: chloride channel protein, partial [Oleispira sp.]|nr:chloride channel protein [Oleispira sp.]
KAAGKPAAAAGASLAKDSGSAWAARARGAATGDLWTLQLHSCREGESEYNGKCYRLLDSLDTDWDFFAEGGCSAIGAGWDIVKVETSGENDFLTTMISEATWIGGDDIAQEGSWHWQDGTEFFTNNVMWDDGQPAGSGHDCLALNTGGTWYDYGCGDNNPALCEGPLAGAGIETCGFGESTGPDGLCYYVDTVGADWATAQATCQARGTGWDLAGVSSQAVNEFVTGKLGDDPAWMYITDQEPDEIWERDGSTPIFSAVYGCPVGTDLNLVTGLCTAITSIYLPEVMGVGYDSVNTWLQGEVIVGLTVALLLAKLVLSGWAAAMGFPGGLIGPSLFMGAAIGVVMGQLSSYFMPHYPINIGFYAMLGMGAMMASVLRAPLAALMALLELTANPNLILPGMLAIVIASLTVSEVFHLPSIFRVQTNLAINQNPVQQLLRNTWVGQVMSQDFNTSPRLINLVSAQLMLSHQPAWIFLETEQQLLLSSDLARFIENHIDPHENDSANTEKSNADRFNPVPLEIDCLLLPGERKMVKSISLMANLQNALDQMQQHHIEWLVVHRDEQFNQVVGIISREMIEHHYRYQPQTSHS